MKKIFTLAILLALAPVLVLAAFKPATLTNGVERVAAYTESEAKALFAKGFTLDETVGGSSDSYYNRIFFFGGYTRGGSILALSTSTAAQTLTASQVCGNGSIKITPLGAAATYTLPATSTALFSKCLPTIGSSIDLNLQVVGTSTTIAAGAGGTLGYTSAASIAAGKYGILRIFRNGTSTYLAYLINIPN